MNSKIILFSAFCLCASLTAQDNLFEGEIHYKSLENHDKTVIQYSAGMAYNGARETSYIIKGNKVLFRDECTHMSLLLNPDEDVIILYSDLIGEGMQFKYKKYSGSYLSSFSRKGQEVMGQTFNVPSTYRFIPEGEVDFLGYKADFLNGRIENEYASTTFELYRINSINVSKTMYAAQMYGMEIEGLVSKIVWQQTNQSPMLGTMKSYVMTELERIVERPVDEKEFEIPRNIKIVVSDSPFKVLNLYKKNHKYLEKHNMYPTQVEQNVVYKINEEWDF